MRFKRGTGLRNLKNEARLGGEKWILDEKTNKVYRISVGDAFPTKRVLDFLLPINRIAADTTSRMLQKSNLCIVLAEATAIKICNKFQHLLAGYRKWAGQCQPCHIVYSLLASTCEAHCTSILLPSGKVAEKTGSGE